MNLAKITIPFIKTQKQISIEYIGAFLLIVFCNFWLFGSKPIAPLYYFFIISLVLSSFLLFKGSISITYTQVVSLICCGYCFVVSLCHKETNINTNIHVALSFIFYFLSIFYFKKLKPDKVHCMVKILDILSAVYIGFETYWRWTHPIMHREGVLVYKIVEENFYMYKMNSIMFLDSNFVSLITLILTFLNFYLYLYVDKNKFYKIMIYIFAILTIFTLSRMAIIAMFITFMLYFGFCEIKKGFIFLIKHNKFTLKFFLLLVGTLLTLVCILLLLFFIVHIDFNSLDGSFSTKLDIYNNLFNYLKSVSITNIIIGSGSNENMIMMFFHRATHCLIPTLIVWYGFLGLFLIFYFWWTIINATKKKALLILIPVFIVGFSLAICGIHVFYVSLAIIYYFENILPKQERRQNAISLNNNANI